MFAYQKLFFSPFLVSILSLFAFNIGIFFYLHIDDIYAAFLVSYYEVSLVSGNY